LPPADVYLMCEPDAVVPLLLEAVQRAPRGGGTAGEEQTADETLSLRALADELQRRDRRLNVCLARLPLDGTAPTATSSTRSTTLAVTAAGRRCGPGHDRGAALALQDSGRLWRDPRRRHFLMGVTRCGPRRTTASRALLNVANQPSFTRRLLGVAAEPAAGQET